MSAADGSLDPSVDFERYRAVACRRFIAIAQGAGYHRFFDLKQHSEDLYSDFWVDLLGRRPHRQLEVANSLPARERVVRAAVGGRDSKKKDAPPAGYRLAAARLGISEVRAKKLSRRANERIRAAVERIESGQWCERWTRSIELVAAGKPGETGFPRHAEHCVKCRTSVAHLREQATLRCG
jgi:hypothetical protein